VTGPSWLRAAFAALMIVTAAYCASRLAACRLLGKRTEADADGLHVLMGVAMAGMFEPGLSPVPGAMWRAVFTAAAAWFGWQALRARHGHPARLRSAHPAPHAVESAAMTYMFWAAGTPPARPGEAMPGMTGTPTGANLALTVVLAVFMLGHIVWTADLMAARSPAKSASPARPDTVDRPDVPLTTRASAPRVTDAVPIARNLAANRPALAPRLAACYKIAMSIAMGYMLITML
jgi:hypothetical protein